MSNQLTTYPDERSLTAIDVRSHVNLIQEVMKAVMKPDVHYGVIPGCKQPSLYKAGSEVLLSTFRIAVSVAVDDLSGHDEIRYRVRVTGTHQTTGIVVGEGIGECSSNETKYKWKRCYVSQEFDATPENRRRIRFSDYKGKISQTMEVRTEPADVANTILKMAKKRAQIDMTLTATAASDIFTQDVEDLPEDLRQEQDYVEPRNTKPATTPPQRKSEQVPVTGAVTAGQVRVIRSELERRGVTEPELLAHFKAESVEMLPQADINTILDFIKSPADADA